MPESWKKEFFSTEPKHRQAQLIILECEFKKIFQHHR